MNRFRDIIYRYHRKHGRNTLPWRQTKDPYKILVSEIMLQQTQTARVLQKYPPFIRKFPGFADLAKAPLRSILEHWQGMGYYRRALALKETSMRLQEPPYFGKIPRSPEDLMRFPGIGPSTASAVAAFAFQRPVAFIETNIRRVFIHFFFHRRRRVPDREILPLVEKTMDRTDPRSWYYALMDYGAMLARQGENPNRRSAHMQRNTPFRGSDRQIRGSILRSLLLKRAATKSELVRLLDGDEQRIVENLVKLMKEGFLLKKGNRFFIR